MFDQTKRSWFALMSECAACIEGPRQTLEARSSWAKTDTEILSVLEQVMHVKLHGSSCSLVLGTIYTQTGLPVVPNQRHDVLM